MESSPASRQSTPMQLETPHVAAEDVKKLQKTISQLEQKLIASQRLAVLGSSSAMIAHELNNLMTPIQNWLELALGTDDPTDAHRYVGKAKNQTERANIVMRRLIDLVKGGALAPESCSAAQVVEVAVATIRQKFAKAHIKLNVSIPNDLYVRAQPHLLAQVLLNLLLNARAALDGQSGSVKISARRDSDFVVLDVRDTGKGLTPEQLDEVINPFLSVQDKCGPDWNSVGLGLSACRLITREHGATLEGLANEGPGCTFRLRWPVGN